MCLLQVQLEGNFPGRVLIGTPLAPVKCGNCGAITGPFDGGAFLVFLVIWLIETFEYMAVPFR